LSSPTRSSSLRASGSGRSVNLRLNTNPVQQKTVRRPMVLVVATSCMSRGRTNPPHLRHHLCCPPHLPNGEGPKQRERTRHPSPPSTSSPGQGGHGPVDGKETFFRKFLSMEPRWGVRASRDVSNKMKTRFSCAPVGSPIEAGALTSGWTNQQKNPTQRDLKEKPKEAVRGSRWQHRRASRTRPAEERLEVEPS